VCDRRHQEELAKSISNSNIRIVAASCNEEAHGGKAFRTSYCRLLAMLESGKQDIESGRTTLKAD